MSYRKRRVLGSIVLLIFFSAGGVGEAWPQSPAALKHFQRGLACYRRGDFMAAIEEFSRAIQINSNLPARGDKDNRSLLTQREAVSDGDLEPILIADSFNARAYHNRGVARRAIGDLDGAIDDFTRSIRMAPDMAQVYINRGNAYQLKGEFGLAIADYNRAIAVEPGSASAYNNRGLARRNQGHLQEALADFDKAIDLKPDSAEAYNNRGAARYESGNLTGAMEDFNAAIRINPLFGAAYCNRGLVKRDQGNVEGALVDFDQAIRLDPRHALAYVNRGAGALYVRPRGGSRERFPDGASVG